MQFSFGVSAKSIFSSVCCSRAPKFDSDQSEKITAAMPFDKAVSAVTQGSHRPVSPAGGDRPAPDEKYYSALLLDEFIAPENHLVFDTVIATAYEKSNVFRIFFNRWGPAQSAITTRSDVEAAWHIAANLKSWHDCPQDVPAALARESSSGLRRLRDGGADAYRPFVEQVIQAMLLQGNKTAEELETLAKGYTYLVMKQMEGPTPVGTRYPGGAVLKSDVESVHQHGGATLTEAP